jgi:hypothetical protein
MFSYLMQMSCFPSSQTIKGLSLWAMEQRSLMEHMEIEAHIERGSHGGVAWFLQLMMQILWGI